MYFLQRHSENFWEEVDQFTYDNMDKAVANGKPRYNGNWVTLIAGHITISAHNISLREVGQISRFCGGDERTTAGIIVPAVAGGFCRKPEYIQFVLRKRNILRDMNKGENYNMSSKKPEEKTNE